MMSKRSIDDVDTLPTHGVVEAKSEKKHKRRKTEEQLPTPAESNGTDTPPVTSEDVTLDKAARKAAKLAKKAAKKARELGDESRDLKPDVDHQADEANAKAAKAARKAARKARKDGSRDTERDAQAATEVNGQNGSTSSDEAALREAKAKRKAERKALKGKKRSRDEDQASPGAGIAAEAQIGSAATPPGQATVDDYLKKHQITMIDDAQKSTGVVPIMSFNDLSLEADALRPVFASYKSPTPIQAGSWPFTLSGRDCIGVAETGSGKTMAFGLPCVQHVMKKEQGKRSSTIRACIVSPTRELALQIYEQMVKLATPVGLKVACVYGGVNKDQQRETLRGVSIIVATPGRLNDFIEEGSISLKKVTFLVLDEADRMLDTGFEPEVRKIANEASGKNRQTLMFTATWPPAVRELAATFMDSPVRIMIGDNSTGELRANVRIDQKVEVMEPYGKNGRLIEVLKQYGGSKAQADRILIFCLYKKEAVRVEDFVRSKGFKVAGIHGDLSQQKRTESLEAFKQGKVRLLIATDVAARGLDIPAVKLVVNYTFPLTADDYVHRIGRTGRAGQTGESITFFTDHEKPLAGALINVLKAANQPVPEELLKYGTTVKKKTHDVYGAFYKDPGEMKKATKITFD